LEQVNSERLEVIRKLRREYAEQWGTGNAAKFVADGHYEWMANSLEGYPFILEVGAGTGEGTKALLRKGHKVISVDENPACLKSAYKALKAEGLEVIYEKREKISINAAGYSAEYFYPEESPVEGGALLLEGDIANDPNLIKWLTEDVAPFDAIVCWLIGTHHARALNNYVQRYKMKDSTEYRLRMQNKIYALADQILRPGGILHLVDRGEEPKEEFLRRDIIEAHRDQAETTSLQVERLDYRLYEEPDGETKIEMRSALGTSGMDPGEVQSALVSVIVRKP
jgi:SAM-dependent methyltransferase